MSAMLISGALSSDAGPDEQGAVSPIPLSPAGGRGPRRRSGRRASATGRRTRPRCRADSGRPCDLDPYAHGSLRGGYFIIPFSKDVELARARRPPPRMLSMDLQRSVQWAETHERAPSVNMAVKAPPPADVERPPPAKRPPEPPPPPPKTCGALCEHSGADRSARRPLQRSQRRMRRLRIRERARARNCARARTKIWALLVQTALSMPCELLAPQSLSALVSAPAPSMSRKKRTKRRTRTRRRCSARRMRRMRYR